MTNMTTLASGQVIAAQYELVRPLASGRDGTTWLARDVQHGRDVVLQFRSAGDAAGERVRNIVQHPALLAPIATQDESGSVLDVFEYLPGGEIGRLRGQPWTLIARRLLPVVEALDQLHVAGWVHGDLNPRTCCSTAMASRISSISAARDNSVRRSLLAHHRIPPALSVSTARQPRRQTTSMRSASCCTNS